MELTSVTELEKDREAFFDDFASQFFSTPKLAGLTSSLKEALEGSRLKVIKDAPHGLAVSHTQELNRILLDILTV